MTTAVASCRASFCSYSSESLFDGCERSDAGSDAHPEQVKLWTSIPSIFERLHFERRIVYVGLW